MEKKVVWVRLRIYRVLTLMGSANGEDRLLERCRRSAFTLIEALMAMTILGLLVTAFSIQYMTPWRLAEIDRDLNQLALLDLQARRIAKQDRKTLQVRFDLEEELVSGSIVDAQSQTILKRIQLSPNTQIRKFQLLDGQSIQSSPTGSLANTNGFYVSPTGMSASYQLEIKTGEKIRTWVFVGGTGQLIKETVRN